MCFTILFLFLTETNCIIYLNSIFMFSFSEIIQSNQVSQNLFQSKYIFFYIGLIMIGIPYIYIYTNEYSSASILHVIDHGDFTIPSPQ